MVKVSVIIPNYNRAAIVAETVENMLSQSLPPHEVIVVDDGSTDGSVEVLRSFGDRITLIQQSNLGPGAARNAGLRVSTGEFIQFMDSDDITSLNKLAVQAHYLTQKKADIVYGPWAKAWLSNHQVKLQNVVLQQRPLPATQSPLFWFLTHWSMIFQQCLVRRAFLHKVGGYREDMRCLEDGDLFVRLLLAGAKLVHESETLTLYRLEDFGKLTASGQQPRSRAVDHAKFYLSLIELADANPSLQSYLHHPAFQLRVWETIQMLASEPITEIDQRSLQSLQSLTNWTQWISPIWRWLSQKNKGLRQRLYRHRWPDCYQAALPTLEQKMLIQTMGWQLAS